jgi:hypothetical protein
MTFLKIMNMTVAITVATVVRRAPMNAQMAKGKEYQREYKVMGEIKIERKFMHVPVRKKPNIKWDAMRMSLRMLLISAGNAMVAPARSSFRRSSTGLNQKSAFGCEQDVMPSSL